jgi:hypothetical protein
MPVVALVVGLGSLAFALAFNASITVPGAVRVPPRPWSVSSPRVVADLPVAICPTAYGEPGVLPRREPRTAAAVVTAPLARSTTVYVDGSGTLAVVAPTSWRCTALDAVDASSTLVVAPPGDPRPTFGTVSAVHRGIVASQTGGCIGCGLETACPLFAIAAHLYRVGYGLTCPAVHKAAETRQARSATIVRFIDPPGTAGVGAPSGGSLFAYGAMAWQPPSKAKNLPPTTWLETCTLPVADHDLCVTSVDAFLTRYPG